MKAAEYPHLTFLRKNNIDVDKLPKLIRQRIKGFEEIQEDLPYLVEEDQPVIEETLQKLSYEIEEDLEEEFEDQLENNEIEEELVEVEKAPDDAEEPEEEFIPEQELIPEPEFNSLPPTPEEILSELYEQGKRRLMLQDLKEAGIPVSNQRITKVGEFCLIKGRYQNCYSLVFRKEKVKEK